MEELRLHAPLRCLSKQKRKRFRKSSCPGGFVMRSTLFNPDPQSPLVQSSSAKNAGEFLHIVDLASIAVNIPRFVSSRPQKNALRPARHFTALPDHLPVRCPQRWTLQQQPPNQPRANRRRKQRDQRTQRRASQPRILRP